MRVKTCNASNEVTMRKDDLVWEQDDGIAAVGSNVNNDENGVSDASAPVRKNKCAGDGGNCVGSRESGNGSLLREEETRSSLNGRMGREEPGSQTGTAGFPNKSANGKMTVGLSLNTGTQKCCGGSRSNKHCHQEERNDGCTGFEAHFSHLSKGTTWLSILLGQVLALLMCISGVTNVYLVDRHNIRIPTAQNFGFYIILATIFTTILACRPADRNLFPILRTRGWKYAIVALVDAEAKFLVCKAYQFTTLTSVQLLDCFAIPTVLSLSWLVLRIRYKVPHILGVSVSLLGICCLVWADVEDGKPLGPGKNRFLGDMLCLCGAFLHGISNVAQEFVVKTFDTVEFLGMIGLFGSFVSGTQTVVLEYGAVTSTDWAGASSTPISLILSYTLSQTVAYLISVFVMKWSSATFFNLSLLTADFYSIMVGIYLFQIKFHSLYFVSFALVMVGVIMFSVKPTVIASHIYKSLTREHTTTLDLELMASSPITQGPEVVYKANRSSVNYVSGDKELETGDNDDDCVIGEGNGNHSSTNKLDKTGPMMMGNGNGNGNGCALLSIQNCDVVMQTSLVPISYQFNGNGNGNKSSSVCAC